MKLINRALAILCVLALLSVGLIASVMAEKEPTPATPTDLDPVTVGVTIPAEEPKPEAEQPETVSETVSEEEPEEALPEEEPSYEEPSEEEPSGEIPSEETPVAESAEEHSEEEAEEDSDKPGIEIVIAKTLQPGQSWNGTVKRKTPTVLKLDIPSFRKVYILVEGEDVLASVQKADRYDESVTGSLTDIDTHCLILELNAEAGSYLIPVKAGEHSLLAKAAVTIMDQAAYDAWFADHQAIEDEQPDDSDAKEETEDETETDPEQAEEQETESETEPEPETEPKTESEVNPEETEEQETEPETETESETEQESEQEPECIPAEEPAGETEDVTRTIRSIEVNVTWDVQDPVIGDTAHFHATLNGYEDQNYSMQWQYSLDRKEWTDITGEANADMDVVVTEENNLYYWRIVVYLEEES